MTLKEKLAVSFKKFLRFVYNKETKEIFGRTVLSWAKLLLFYLVFYLFFTAIFTIHLSVFLAVTPQPGGDNIPWNYGKYAYPNYPNSKIALVSIPKTINYRQGNLVLDDLGLKTIHKILPSASASGVSSSCLNETTKHGYNVQHPCIFLHVAKVFQWTPSNINASLTWTTLPISCTLDTPQNSLTINISSSQVGIPLNLTNTNEGQSFPYSGQSNYITPIMALTLDMSSIHTISGLPSKFSASISCGIDFTHLGLAEPSANRLSRMYEVPDMAEIKLNFRL